MISYFTKTNEDEKEINKSASKSFILNQQPESYRNVVVPKPWGFEFLCAEDSEIATWFLSIGKGHSTSMHCHPNKRTVLVILSGIALGRTLHGSMVLGPGKIVIYEPGVFHSTKGVTKIEMVEIEYPNKKEDLLRLEDNYGREKMGYEGKNTMHSSCDYFYLDSLNPSFQQPHYIISKSDVIKCGSINVVGENKSGIVPNTCILEQEDIQLKGSSILNIRFPSKEKSHEYRKYI